MNDKEVRDILLKYRETNEDTGAIYHLSIKSKFSPNAYWCDVVDEDNIVIEENAGPFAVEISADGSESVSICPT